MNRRVYNGKIINESTRTNKKNSHSRFVIDTILVSVACFLLLGGLFFGYRFLQESEKNEEVVQMWDEVKVVANNVNQDNGKNEISVEVSYSTDPMDRKINWDDLLGINSDVACWMFIPGTNIDYPVMQESKQDEQFYLYRNIYKKRFVSGSLFIPKTIDGYIDEHLLVYGHNMKNDSMFSQLLDYKSKQFYNEHPHIYMYYPDRTEKWTIWSSYNTKENDIIYHSPYERNTDGYENLIKSIDLNKSYSTLVTECSPSDYILTLSTCDKVGDSSKRYVVNAVLSERQ